MVNRRHTRTSRSNTHHSRAHSRNSDRQVSAPSHHPDNEIVSPSPLEERVQRMEEAQLEILRLLQAPQPASTRGALPQPSGLNDVPPPHVPHLRSEVHRQEDELKDTASSTHPALANVRDSQHLSHPENITHPSEIRDEIRRLVQEEFPATGGNFLPPRRRSQKVSPLVKSIRRYPVPPGFKIPNIDSYDGTTDPYEHIDHYRTIMHIQRASDSLLCQVFPATLKNQARTWFYSLPADSVHSFEELATVFTEQFLANRRIIKDSSHLSGIRQNEGESLKEYFKRFSTEARQIPGVDPELLRGVFLGGLRPSPFYSSLMRDTVRSYADLVHKVEAQIAADEAIHTHRMQFESQNAKRRKHSDNVAPSSQRKKFETRRTADLPPPPPPRRDRRPEKDYTPLNTSRVNILMAIQDKQNLKWPPALKPNSGN